MKKWTLYKKILISLGVMFLLLNLEGCAIGLLAAGVGAGVGMVKSANAKKIDAQSKEHEAYNHYVLGMEKINLQREKEHLAPNPILSFHSYQKTTNN